MMIYAKFISKSYLFLITFFLIFWGCASLEKNDVSMNDLLNNEPTDLEQETKEVQIREFMISPGDEINIKVYQHDGLNQKVKIPPDGRIFYPIVGEIDTKGNSLRELRSTITKGLSEYKKQPILPGDEISINVYGHDELNRKLIIPPDGFIFYPLVGEIDTKEKSLKELREIIVNGLSRYRKHYLVPGDDISIIVYRYDELNRKLIIPPDGFIFYPLVGEIDTKEKSLKELRGIIVNGLSKSFKDPQVSVNIIRFGGLKIVVDPQVSVDIVKMSNPKRIIDPQVSVEVTFFGGQKIFVLGEINRSGVFLADGHMNVIEAISMAGGFTLDAKQNSILLIRKRIDKPKPELVVVDIGKFLQEGDMSQNPILQKGDIVYVPRTFIADVDRFFGHLSNIVRPLLDITRGYWLGQNIEVGPRVRESSAD